MPVCGPAGSATASSGSTPRAGPARAEGRRRRGRGPGAWRAGTLNIGHSITIDGNGHHASILSSATTGVNIKHPHGPRRPEQAGRAAQPEHQRRRRDRQHRHQHGDPWRAGHRQRRRDRRAREPPDLRFTQNGITVVPGAGSPSVLNMSLDNVFVADTFGNAFDLRVPDTSHSVSAVVKNSTAREGDAEEGEAAAARSARCCRRRRGPAPALAQGTKVAVTVGRR
jgi:hypothetical protein